MPRHGEFWAVDIEQVGGARGPLALKLYESPGGKGFDQVAELTKIARAVVDGREVKPSGRYSLGKDDDLRYEVVSRGSDVHIKSVGRPAGRQPDHEFGPVGGGL